MAAERVQCGNRCQGSSKWENTMNLQPSLPVRHGRRGMRLTILLPFTVAVAKINRKVSHRKGTACRAST